nr:uncharacterized protein LOC117685073 [Crassostrea gigas]
MKQQLQLPVTNIVKDKSDKEEGDTQELTDVFDDTVESFQRIAQPTDEQDRKLCAELYNLLGTDGKKQEVTEGLKQEVMTATITRVTGKSVKLIRPKNNKMVKVLEEG